MVVGGRAKGVGVPDDPDRFGWIGTVANVGGGLGKGGLCSRRQLHRVEGKLHRDRPSTPLVILLTGRVNDTTVLAWDDAGRTDGFRVDGADALSQRCDRLTRCR
ncbi:hypothetical protein GCM10022214_78230 [Actinomadura miaoliensis]|uniref:Transposase n=1 Tax=Actinomadura miaoliensis TaxID=430685 RepID=A0ABP7X0H3_9ACTN